MIDACRSCHGPDLELVIDLGDQHLSDFATDPDYRPPRYPLRLLRCAGCGLAQLDTSVPRDLLYHDRYGFYSGVNEGIRQDLHDVVQAAKRYVPAPQAWLDIASNDGTLLSFVDERTHRVGVDPVAKFQPLAQRWADQVFPTYFAPDLFPLTSFDVITSVSVFYDLDDPHEFVAGVRRVLHPDGVWLIQQNDLGTMLSEGTVDNVSHEHLTYWSVTTLVGLLEQHDLVVLDVDWRPVNGGCHRVVVGHAGRRVPAPAVGQWLRSERRLASDGMWEEFAAGARGLFAELARVGWIYADQDLDILAASTRGAVLWQAAQLERLVRQAVERNPDKVGRYYSAVGGIPIVSEDQMRANPPAALLVGPYWFADQLVERERAYLEQGGRLVVPLPELRVITKEDLA